MSKGEQNTRAADEAELGQANPTAAYPVFIIVLSCYAILALAYDAFFKPPPEIRRIIQFGDFIVCAVFFADFVRTFRAAPNKWRYMATWGWLDLISSIPVIDQLRVGRLARVFRIIRVLRALRAARLLTHAITEQRTQSTALAAGLASLILIVIGSASILLLEGGPNANIRDAEQALWWAFVTMTTVGYGDAYPVTTEGRAVAIVLMVCGVGFFGVLSGLIAAWFLEPARRRGESELEAMRQEIVELRAAINTLTNTLNPREESSAATAKAVPKS